MKQLLIVVALVVLLVPPLWGQVVVPGTYDFRVCDGPCANATSRDLAAGVLVLFADSIGFAESLKSNAHDLVNRLLHPAAKPPMPNACFKVDKRERYVNGREYYFGIIPRSTTVWTARNHSVSVIVYSSPDANHFLKWSLSQKTPLGVWAPQLPASDARFYIPPTMLRLGVTHRLSYYFKDMLFNQNG
ncbi:MAG: hypothetical protein WEE89_18055 [Gemmatimonadota bacterium]